MAKRSGDDTLRGKRGHGHGHDLGGGGEELTREYEGGAIEAAETELGAGAKTLPPPLTRKDNKRPRGLAPKRTAGGSFKFDAPTKASLHEPGLQRDVRRSAARTRRSAPEPISAGAATVTDSSGGLLRPDRASPPAMQHAPTEMADDIPPAVGSFRGALRPAAGLEDASYPDAADLEEELSRTAVRELDESAASALVDNDLVREMRGGDPGAHGEGDGPDTQLEVPLPPTQSRAITSERTAPPEIPPEVHDYWSERAAQLRREADAAASARRAGVLLYELGRVYEDRLYLHEKALAIYRESHARYPSLGVCVRAIARITSGRRDFASAVRVLDSELGTSTSAAERVVVLVDRARLRLDHLGDLEGARADIARALDIDPEDPVAYDLMVEVLRRSGDYAALESLWRRKLRFTEEPRLRSVLLAACARLREGHGGDVEGAAALYRTALNTSPSNTHAMRALLRTARAADDYPSVARLCEQLGDLEEGSAAAAHYAAAARIYEGKLRNAELAINALVRALEHRQDLAMTLELADLFERERRWEELAATLERALPLAGDLPAEGSSADAGETPEVRDRGEATVIAYRLGAVRLEHLDDAVGAVAALRHAVRLSPDHTPARQLLGRLYARLERWDDLVELLRSEMQIYSDPGRRAATLFRIGDLQENRAGDPERAIEAYEQALALIPGYRPAMRAISRVYRTLERHEDLIAIYESELSQVESREQKILLLRRIAELWERKLSVPAAALSAHERLLSIEPSNLPALRALRRIYELGNQHEQLVDALRSEAEQVGDRWRRVALLTEAAEVQLKKLADSGAALDTYLEVLGIAPDHQPALMAAGRLLAAAGRWDDLVAVHRRELDQAEDSDHRAWLLMKIGRLCEEQLDRPDDAADAYNEALRLRGDEAQAASDRLAGMFRRLGRYGDLFGILAKQPLPDSPMAQSIHHRQIAEVLQHGQRPALAVEHLRRALTASDDDAALQLLKRLYTTVEDRQSVINLHQMEVKRASEPAALLAAHFKLARLYAVAEHDLERAAASLSKVLSYAPRDRAVLRQLEILLCRLGRWDELASVLELASEPSEDPDYRRGCAMLVAGIREDRSDDLQSAAQSAVDVLAGDPGNTEALLIGERHYRNTQSAEGLAQVLSRQLKTAQTVDEQVAVLCSIAAIHGRRGDADKAAEIYRLASDQNPSNLSAVRGWLHAARVLGDVAQQAEALEREGAASEDGERRIGCYFAAAHTWETQASAPERACAAYQKVLDLSPGHEAATQALTKLLTSRHQWPELVKALESSAEVATSNDERREILARVADLQRSRLNDLLAARRTITRALEIDPNHQQLLTTLAELCRVSEDFKALAQVNRRLVRLTEDPVLLKALHFELGRIWEEKLVDVQAAIGEYRRVLEIDANDLGALTRISALLLREKDWMPAARATEMLIQRDDDRNRVRNYHMRLAFIYARGFNDIPGAIEACRRALALDPGDLKATEQMASLLNEAGDLRALHAHLESTLTVHRARLDQDPFTIESYQALIQAFSRQRAADREYIVRALLDFIGAAGAETRAFVDRTRRATPSQPHRALTEEEIAHVLMHPDERGPLDRLLRGAEAALRKLYEPVERSVAKPTKVTSRSASELYATLRALAKTIGTSGFTAYLVDAADVESETDLWVEDTATPSVFVTRELAATSDSPLTRFRLARVLAHVRLSHVLWGRLGHEELGRAVSSLLTVLVSSYASPLNTKDIDELAVKLEKAISRRMRAGLESAAIEISDLELDPQRWIASMAQSEDRVALAVTGDLQAAMRVLLRDESYSLRPRLGKPSDFAEAAGPRLRGLMSFAVSDEHLTLRERLGLAIEGKGQ
ncbi:MAG: tetratricopeptide repeat protein [Myxococcales bacterium]|nr:tetratricopeptide repeat protein [Myxococcales bacterium]